MVQLRAPERREYLLLSLDMEGIIRSHTSNIVYDDYEVLQGRVIASVLIFPNNADIVKYLAYLKQVLYS